MLFSKLQILTSPNEEDQYNYRVLSLAATEEISYQVHANISPDLKGKILERIPNMIKKALIDE